MLLSPRLMSWTTAGVLTALLCLFVGWLFQEPAPLQTRPLPDGTVLRLEAVTYGDQHRYVKGRYWQRFLAPVLPPALQQLSGATVYTYRIVSPKNVRPLVFWISRSPRSSSFYFLMPRAALDEHGSELDGVALPFGLPPATGDSVQCCA